MKRRVMNKRAQFYLIAAVIIVAIIVGFVSVKNYAKISPKNTVVYDLSKELGFEGEKVLSFGLYKDLNEENMSELKEHFSNLYNEYAGTDKEIYFVFGTKDGSNINAKAYTFTEVVQGTIDITIGTTKQGLEITRRVRNETGTTTDSGKVKISIEGKEYEFNLEEGENFYFVVSQQIGDEKYVAKE